MARIGRSLLVAGLVIALPVAGAALSGASFEELLAFPPRPVKADPAAFSWVVFGVILAAVVLVAGPFVLRVARSRARPAPPAGRFPRWGWAAAGLILAAWVAAWGGLGGSALAQRHAFTPLWLGYIGLVNALTQWRAGTCLPVRRPGLFLGLFPLSAGFWWLFEHLNRFTHNWYYVGIGDQGDWTYFWLATPAFATVLPAVLGTRDLLTTFPGLSAGLDRGWALPLPSRQILTVAALGGGGLALLAIGWRGEWFFPLLWVGPLLLLWGLQARAGEPTLLGPAAAGNWRPFWLAALAALVCGFFWELWNSGSLAHWEYAIPYAGRFHLFEMPILGYAGYLPFGPECVTAALLVLGPRPELLYGPAVPLSERSGGVSGEPAPG